MDPGHTAVVVRSDVVRRLAVDRRRTVPFPSTQEAGMEATIDRWSARFLAAGFVTVALLVSWLSGPTSDPDASAIGASDMQQSGQCEDPALHGFDFWIGTWTVTNPDGDTVGVNRISATAGGCGILEEWEGSSGNVGTSLTAYDPGRDEWFQHWVGSDGAVLKLTGDFDEAGRLVLTGLPRMVEREDEKVELVDRISWSGLDDGGVLQVWEISSNGGESWSPAFSGSYQRMTDGEGGFGDGSLTVRPGHRANVVSVAPAASQTISLSWSVSTPSSSGRSGHGSGAPSSSVSVP